MVDLVRDLLPTLFSICRENGVRRLWLFGSATGRSARPFTDDSDIDLLVDFDPNADVPKGWQHPLFSLPELLEPVFIRPVHVTELADFKKICTSENRSRRRRNFFMTYGVKTLIFDIQRSGNSILRMTDSSTYEQFENNEDLRAAVERPFTIIGEAANRLKKVAPDTFAASSDLRGAIKLRNFIIHVYDLVLPEKLWPVIKGELPALLTWVDAQVD